MTVTQEITFKINLSKFDWLVRKFQRFSLAEIKNQQSFSLLSNRQAPSETEIWVLLGWFLKVSDSQSVNYQGPYSLEVLAEFQP